MSFDSQFLLRIYTANAFTVYFQKILMFCFIDASNNLLNMLGVYEIQCVSSSIFSCIGSKHCFY
uniref:Uncharacterized protein n=1 Tax=Anguilla anguilla TaxID=7936 RepID=A0A0E9VHV9_ANGAN